MLANHTPRYTLASNATLISGSFLIFKFLKSTHIDPHQISCFYFLYFLGFPNLHKSAKGVQKLNFKAELTSLFHLYYYYAVWYTQLDHFTSVLQSSHLMNDLSCSYRGQRWNITSSWPKFEQELWLRVFRNLNLLKLVCIHFNLESFKQNARTKC